jgi:hypothetical protein
MIGASKFFGLRYALNGIERKLVPQPALIENFTFALITFKWRSPASSFLDSLRPSR